MGEAAFEKRPGQESHERASAHGIEQGLQRLIGAYLEWESNNAGQSPLETISGARIKNPYFGKDEEGRFVELPGSELIVCRERFGETAWQLKALLVEVNPEGDNGLKVTSSVETIVNEDGKFTLTEYKVEEAEQWVMILNTTAEIIDLKREYELTELHDTKEQINSTDEAEILQALEGEFADITAVPPQDSEYINAVFANHPDLAEVGRASIEVQAFFNLAEEAFELMSDYADKKLKSRLEPSGVPVVFKCNVLDRNEENQLVPTTNIYKLGRMQKEDKTILSIYTVKESQLQPDGSLKDVIKDTLEVTRDERQRYSISDDSNMDIGSALKILADHCTLLEAKLKEL